MSGALRRNFSDGRVHLQHGPIDLIIQAWGPDAEIAAALDQAEAAFAGTLAGLVDELPVLRRAIGDSTPSVQGPVARRMVQAVWPHRRTFVTCMAAVAGAVADHILKALVCGRSLKKAYVNNGGDIAVHLTDGETITLGLAGEQSLFGRLEISAAMPVRGVATSGWRGRSFSFGIADAVTVLAGDAARADVAATLIANAVTIDHPSIERMPACELDPDSDLGTRPVTVEVGELDQRSIENALAPGRAVAAAMQRDGLIEAAGLLLCGRFVEVGGLQALTAGSADVACSSTERSFG